MPPHNFGDINLPVTIEEEEQQEFTLPKNAEEVKSPIVSEIQAVDPERLAEVEKRISNLTGIVQNIISGLLNSDISEEFCAIRGCPEPAESQYGGIGPLCSGHGKLADEGFG